MNDPQITIYQSPGRIMTDVIIYDRRGDGMVTIRNHDGSENTVDQGAAIDTDAVTFRATEGELRALYYALKDHLRIGTEKNYTDGKLEQVEKHLNDMRVIALNQLMLDKHI